VLEALTDSSFSIGSQPTDRQASEGARNTGLAVADIGGLPLAGGCRLRRGLLYRISGALVGPADLAHLQTFKLRLVVDLRGAAEDRSKLSRWAADYGVAYHHRPVMSGAVADILREAGSSVEAAVAIRRSVYRQIVDDYGISLAGAVALMAHDVPAGFGCAAGKDRTGILAALIQTLLGASEDDVVADYIALAPDVERLRTMVGAWEAAAEVDLTAPGIDTILSTSDELMRESLAHINERWGSSTAYLQAHGLTTGDIESLRSHLVDH
jgi:protein-tyrosine phosphatase